MPSNNPNNNHYLEEGYQKLRNRVGDYGWEKDADIPAMLIAIRWLSHPNELTNGCTCIKKISRNGVNGY